MSLVNCNNNLLLWGSKAKEIPPPPPPPNQPPVNILPPVIQQGGGPVTTAAAGSIIFTTVGSWTGTPVITYSYQWRRNGVNISGAVNNFLTLLDAWIGDDIDVVVTATNAFGVVSQSSAVTVEVVAVPINNVVAPSISGPTGEGGTLICNGGSWTGSSITFTFQWRKNGINIGGATAGVYVTQNSDVGATIDVVVTATNTLGAVSVPSSNQIVVTVTAPVNITLPVVTGYNQLGQVVTSNNGTWYGTPIITFTYQWLRDGVPIGGATLANYTITAPDVGTQIRCQVTATNGIGSTSAISNAASPIPPLDPDAEAYILAEGITDTNEILAVNNLFIALKSNGLYAFGRAMYLYLGSCTLNALNPVNSDAAYRLVYSGGWTFGAGALPNGVNAWANTFLDVGYFNTENGLSQGVFTLTPKITTLNAGYQGVRSLPPQIFLWNTNSGLAGAWFGDAGNQIQWTDNGLLRGFRGGSRTRGVTTNGVRRIGITGIAVQATATNTLVSGGAAYIGALNQAGTPVAYSDQALGFSWFGTDLTSAQLSILRTIATDFNNALGR